MAKDSQPLVLLTRPWSHASHGARHRLRPLVQDLRFRVGSAYRATRPPFTYRRWPGHAAVTGALVRGLEALEVQVRLNPVMERHAPKMIGVLSGLETLQSTVDPPWKSPPRVVAGPNLVVLPSEGSGVLTHDGIWRIVVPSEWVRLMWCRDLPELESKVSVWSAGVDYRYWSPTQAPKRLHGKEPRVLVYLKATSAPVTSVVTMLQDLHFPFSIVEYGNYRPCQFRSQLRRSDLVLYLGGSESQGLALHEAWATDVPTFVYAPAQQHVLVPDGREFCLTGAEFSSAPYLTDERGSFWSTIHELELLLTGFRPTSYSPRRSSIKEFSQESSAVRYLEMFQ